MKFCKVRVFLHVSYPITIYWETQSLQNVTDLHLKSKPF